MSSSTVLAAPLSAAAAAAPDTGLPERIARERLRLVLSQVRRLPLISVVSEGYVWWLLSRIDLFWAGLLWAVMILAAQLWRWLYVRRLPATPPDPSGALAWLSSMLVVLGVLRGSLVVAVFAQPVQPEHYIFTMFYLGLMAGAVGSVAGQVRPFLVWGVVSCGGLAGAWVFLGDVGGFWLGVLILSVLAVLTGNVRDQGRGLTQLVTLAYDNERLAQSLRIARDLSESASLSKTRFFAAASHDLRQPLHALSINATTLEILARRDANPMIRELSQSINRALNQSNGLLDSLLDISNLDARAVKPHWRAVDVARLLDDVREGFAALAAQRGLTLLLDTPPSPLWAWTDPDLLRRILNNLVGNALKFSHEGGVTLGVASLAASSAAAPGQPMLKIFVADTGCGIAETELERVFEEFYQIGNRSRDRSNGLGLGLSIVRRTAELLGAALELRSTPGAGTRVELRMTQAAPPVDAVADAAPCEQPESGMLVGLKVLVVDDEPEILHSLQGLLTQLGCAVRCAEDGGQAIDILAQGFVPQVMLVDHRLRDESGLDVIACVQAVLGPVPAVVVTGDTEPATIQLTHAAGHRVIHKPVQGIQVIRALREAVRGAGAPIG